MKYLLFLFIITGIIAAGFFYWQNGKISVQNRPAAVNTPEPPKKVSFSSFLFPVARANERTTKKLFGTFVSLNHSPVSPEHFTGYHTGVDFETFPEEENLDVPVSAACFGTLLLKKWASGYGGVVVESCTLNGEPVTVIYGHLKLSSVVLATGDMIPAGMELGVLGKGYSGETDGERMHLHFGIHKGPGINIRGYVSNPEDLKEWLDSQRYLK